MTSGELPEQDTETSSAAVLGIMTETLVRPLGESGRTREPEKLVQEIVHLGLAAIGATDRSGAASVAPTWRP